MPSHHGGAPTTLLATQPRAGRRDDLHGLADLLRADTDLVRQIIAACQQEAAALQLPDPGQLKSWKAQAEKLSRTIDFNRRNPGETDKEQDETARVLKQLRAERADLVAKINLAEAARDKQVKIPTEEEVINMLNNLSGILAAAGTSEGDEQQSIAREIVRRLTGGKILLYQQGERSGPAWLVTRKVRGALVGLPGRTGHRISAGRMRARGDRGDDRLPQAAAVGGSGGSRV